ncbi:MAG: arsinothricin resistance N-acetyltransferase ArsN1 family B [Pyrinomonadaceae bacterium]
MNIRKVETADALNVAGIYNHYIQNTHHTFETEPLTEDEMRTRIEKVTKSFPFLVAEGDNEILGYAYATQFKLRNAYKHSSEVSIYVKNAAKQKGVGTSLYTSLFDELYETHIHTIVAGISLPNEASVRFHEKLGFKKVAHFREIGYKLGRWIDVGYWEMLTV